MAGVLPDPTVIGQKALELPKSVLDLEMRQMTEKVSNLTTGIQNFAAGVPPLPVMGQGLPPLPGLPELPGMGAAGAGTGGAPQTRSEATQGVKRNVKKMSYMEA